MVNRVTEPLVETRISSVNFNMTSHFLANPSATQPLYEMPVYPFPIRFNNSHTKRESSWKWRRRTKEKRKG
jgi:hypothetical protein